MINLYFNDDYILESTYENDDSTTTEDFYISDVHSDKLLALAEDNNKTLHEIADSLKEYLETMQQIVKEMK